MHKVIESLRTTMLPSFPNLFAFLEEQTRVSGDFDSMASNIARQLTAPWTDTMSFHDFLSNLDSLVAANHPAPGITSPAAFLAVCQAGGTCSFCTEGRVFCLLGKTITLSRTGYRIVRVDSLTSFQYKANAMDPTLGFADAEETARHVIDEKRPVLLKGHSTPFLFVTKEDPSIQDAIDAEDSTEIIKRLGLSHYAALTEQLVVTLYPTNCSLTRVAKPTVIDGWGHPPFRVDPSSDEWGKAAHLETGVSCAPEACHCPVVTDDSFAHSIWPKPGAIDYRPDLLLDETKKLL